MSLANLYIPPGLPQYIKEKFKIKKYTVEDDEFEKQQDREISEKMKDLGLQDHSHDVDKTIYKNNFPLFEDPITTSSTTSTVKDITRKIKKG